MKKFDLIVIGGGAGAFAAAIRANELKTKTALINADLPIGGTCVNVGCVPSKALLYAGGVLHHAEHHGVSGVELEVKNFDFQKVVQDELALVERLRKGKYEKVLKSLEYVTFIEGKATFTAPKEIEVNPLEGSGGAGEKLSAEKFIVATGSTANVLSIEGINEVGYITHIEALKLERQPRELVVIGAGPVGLEFAQMYSRFGTRVTVLQYASRIFPPGEPELTGKLANILISEGIAIHTNVKAAKVRAENGKKVLTFSIQGGSASGKGVDGEENEVSADEILLAAGKSPNTKELGLDKVGVKVDKKQAISVNQFFKTSQDYIFAVGDVTNLPLRLETTAGREGTLAAGNVIEGTQNSVDYHAVPYTIFTDPQYASVGYTEEAQMKNTGVCACRTVSFADVPKGFITHRTEGLIKMGVDPKTKQILGVHILAPDAGDLIAEAMMLVKNKNTIDDVISSLPVFPTMSEAVKIVALSFVKDISKLSCCV